MRIAVDVGGTFTDVVILDEISTVLTVEKVPTTPGDPAKGVLQSFKKAAAPLQEIDYFIHGTTLGLNALLTKTSSRVALLTTKGFRDVYLLGRTARDPMYDLTYHKPLPLVPRAMTFEITERMNYEGNVLVPFDEGETLALVKRLRDLHVESVALVFLHSYANPAHEIAVEQMIEAECPDIFVTCSHRLIRVYREYERTSTAVIDAAIKPIMHRYLETLNADLTQNDFGGHFLLTRSGGGAMTYDAAKDKPAHLILSGPAGGVIGASGLSDLFGHRNLITLDMGGTSLDASLIINGDASITNDARFQNLPIALPTIDLTTIGAGGGSVGWIDDGGHLQIGPQSAGAIPGPACYGNGGIHATFTDAALAAGYLDPTNFLGGEMSLDLNAALEVIHAQLSAPLSLTVEQVALGMHRIMEAKITGTIREISIQRGFHPHDFALFAFGGGGGFVACGVARELEIPTVIIPPNPSNFSALGMLMVDVVHDFGQTYLSKLEDIDPAELQNKFTGLEGDAAHSLNNDGFHSGNSAISRTAELRYEGQEHTVTVALPSETIRKETIVNLAVSFGDKHAIQYGHRTDDPVELVTLRVHAVGLLPKPELPRLSSTTDGLRAAIKTIRPVVRPAGEVDFTVYDRHLLSPGDQITGPAIVEERSSTTVVLEHDSLTVGDHGELVIFIASNIRP